MQLQLKYKLLPMVWRQLAWVTWVCVLEPELQPGYWLKDRHNHRDCSGSFCTSSPAVFWHWQNKLHKLAGAQNINPFHFLVKTMLLNPTGSVYPGISYLDPLTSLPLLPRAWCERKPPPPMHSLSAAQINHFPIELPSLRLSYWEFLTQQGLRLCTWALAGLRLGSYFCSSDRPPALNNFQNSSTVQRDAKLWLQLA